MRDVTLLFLIKRKESKITDILLAMKKRGFGEGRWNGVGGKVNTANETIEVAVVREAYEEIGVRVANIQKIAELTFYFESKPEWNQLGHVYFTETWEGQISESDEMRPQWFPVKDIPYKEMWADDIYWLPMVLEEKLIKGEFTFDENDRPLKHEIKLVENFES